jgi:hypothetical protein
MTGEIGHNLIPRAAFSRDTCGEKSPSLNREIDVLNTTSRCVDVQGEVHFKENTTVAMEI